MNQKEQGKALLESVKQATKDDLPRSIYADWCDDVGETARAELIRVQVELALLMAVSTVTHDCGEMGKNGFDPPCPACTWNERWFALKGRQRDILRDPTFDIWKNFAPWAPHEWTMTTNFNAALSPIKGPAFRIGDREGHQDIWHHLKRGFVQSIVCQLHDWCGNDGLGGHGSCIVQHQPITRVRITDRKAANYTYPNHTDLAHSWHTCLAEAYGLPLDMPLNLNNLPNPLWRALPGPIFKWHGLPDHGWKTYGSDEEANAALSQACLTLAQARARSS